MVSRFKSEIWQTINSVMKVNFWGRIWWFLAHQMLGIARMVPMTRMLPTTRILPEYSPYITNKQPGRVNNWQLAVGRWNSVTVSTRWVLSRYLVSISPFYVLVCQAGSEVPVYWTGAKLPVHRIVGYESTMSQLWILPSVGRVPSRQSIGVLKYRLATAWTFFWTYRCVYTNRAL